MTTLAHAAILPYRASDMIVHDLPDRLGAYVRWVRETALPTWSSAGYDSRGGRFRERLDRNAAPLDVPIRAMVQARQIYVFAHAAELGWFPEGEALAERAMTSLLRDFYVEAGDAGSFAFSIDGSGAIVSDVRDAYTHAFALFALAWLYRRNGAARLLKVADRTIAFIDAALHCPTHGGLFDAHPVIDRGKRQNPLMHLFEAYLFLEEAAPGRGYLERAGGLVALFKKRLFTAQPGVLLEHFGEDWADHADIAKAGVWEPGHHFEWVWLLDRYGRTAGEDLSGWSDRLHDTAMKHGLAPDGLIYDEVGRDCAVRKPSHRLWPHTEAIKAAAARHATGDRGAQGVAESMAGMLLHHFCGAPFAGGWTDQIGVDHTAIVDYVPASSLYHLFLAAAEADAVFGHASAMAA